MSTTINDIDVIGNRRSCKGKCVGWKHMINFIAHVPRYALADYCVMCEVWYPKFCVVFCPCCEKRVRIKKQQNDRRWPQNHTNKQIAQLIEHNIAKGWTLLKEDIYDDMIEYSRLTKKVNERREKEKILFNTE